MWHGAGVSVCSRPTGPCSGPQSSAGGLRGTCHHRLLGGRGFDWPYRKQWPWCLSCLAGVGVQEKKRCGKQLGPAGRFDQVARASSPIIEFLVDGDCGSIELVKHAISRLKNIGGHVRTQIFAEPRRTENKKWCEFLEEPGITFRPVPRSKDHSREPNDEAIETAMQKLSTRRAVHRIALLTRDTDFISIMLKLADTNPSYLVLVPESDLGVAAKYQENGLEVLELKHSDGHPRVQAILHEDGAGSVQLSDPFTGDGPSVQQKFQRVKSFLEDLGYSGHPRQACTKFWFVNGLGRLIVYPTPTLTLAVHKRIKASKTASWQRNSDQLAFLLPTHGGRGATDATRMTYGNTFARAIFRGGGPFILKDSKDLTIQALKRLRYLDEWNPDEYEAMLCFVNTACNKYVLRKMDLLPEASDCSRDVEEKLRAAFLSSAYPGEWQQPAAAANQMKSIIGILKNAGLLSEKKETSGEYCHGYSKDEISQALSIYAREQQLPPCKTFNCLAWRIFARINSEDPCRRGTLEFRR